MKKLVSAILAFFLVLPFAACSPHKAMTAASKTLTAEEIVTDLKNTGLPIGTVIVYNENTDENHLLGRSHQYISKANFADSRIEQYDESEDPAGGSVETFKTVADLNSRKTYIQKIGEGIPTMQEYLLVNGTSLLRLSHDLTNDQINEYKKAFESIK